MAAVKLLNGKGSLSNLLPSQVRGRAAEMREGAARLRQCVERGQAAEAEGWAECCTEWRKDIRVCCQLCSIHPLMWNPTQQNPVAICQSAQPMVRSAFCE